MGTVLLIEDSADDVLLIRLAFEKGHIGQSLMVVSEAQQAIDYLKGSGPYAEGKHFPIPKLILLDLSLPGSNGFEFLEWLRDDPELKSLPVVILSGSMRPEDVTRVCRLGASSFLQKTSDTTRFRADLKATIDFWFGTDSSQ